MRRVDDHPDRDDGEHEFLQPDASEEPATFGWVSRFCRDCE